jgi:hypothetical protein
MANMPRQWRLCPAKIKCPAGSRPARTGRKIYQVYTEIRENYSVTINGRHPWTIRYQFQANGQSQEGKVTTLNPPGHALQLGKAVCVLYLPTDPKWSSIFPHP